MTDHTPSDDEAPLDLRPLPGSERPPAEGVAPAARALDSGQRIEVTVVLRRREEIEDEGELLSREEFVERHGAAPEDIELATSTFESLGVSIVSVDRASRRMRLAATVAAFGRVFGTSIERVTSRAAEGVEVEHRHRTGGLSVPAALDGVVTAVLGLDDRPQARAQFRVAAPHAVTTSYTPLELGELYRFPEGTDGTGRVIAIVELGGGYDDAELKTYFAGLGVTAPTVTAVGVDGAGNAPEGTADGADGEVVLDIEVAGALAPGAELVVYFAPNTDAGFVDAVSDAAHAAATPTSISISWGQNEDVWTAQARRALDDAFVDAAALGATVTVAAGDNGSTDGASDGRDHADFPASSPHVLACGGTSLVASGGSVHSETVWNGGSGGGATGGGVSDAFPVPSWQVDAGVPASSAGTRGRGVPDVAGDADPATGYRILVDGESMVIGGTSAVAPLWAALVARLAQSAGRPLGLLQPTLYRDGATGFRDVVTGNNGGYRAGPGWDACTGLGVPDGEALTGLFPKG